MACKWTKSIHSKSVLFNVHDDWLLYLGCIQDAQKKNTLANLRLMPTDKGTLCWNLIVGNTSWFCVCVFCISDTFSSHRASKYDCMASILQLKAWSICILHEVIFGEPLFCGSHVSWIMNLIGRALGHLRTFKFSVPAAHHKCVGGERVCIVWKSLLTANLVYFLGCLWCSLILLSRWTS
jgi:hypothetical protein